MTSSKQSPSSVRDLHKIHVLHNGQPATMGIPEIFDAQAYPQLIALTGTVTPDFINQYLDAFVKVEIALGAQPTPTGLSATETITKGALPAAMLKTANKEPAKLFHGLSRQMQLNALAGLLKLDLAPTQAVHSRFVLLSNPTTQQTRVVLGSFDLTKASFDPDHNRFEEVLVFDDPTLYENLNSHFKVDMLPVMQPYFTNELLNAAEKQVKAMKKDHSAAQSVVILSNEETDRIAQAELTNLLVNDVQRQLDKQLAPVDLPLGLRNVTTNYSVEKDTAERHLQQREMILKLEKEAVSPRAAHPKLRERAQINKRVVEAFEHAVSPEDLAVEKKYTTFLYDRPLERNVAHNTTGLYTPNDTGSYPLPFGKLATISELREGLHQIDAVMQGYAKFVVDYTPEYGKRFFEAILYGFTAPFLWEIRTKASLNPEDGNDVPNFLILGATAGSGKSTLLRIINQLTWNTANSMIDFGTIYPNETQQRKAKTVQALESYMKQGSTYPVLVDEIEPYFFQQPQYSRELVVDTMNQLVNSPKPIAPLIGTTNYNGGFSMARETARRTYYLQLDKVIDDQRKSAATKYIYNVRQVLNNTLFKDFVVRMANYLADDQTQWRVYDQTTGQLDFLALTRQIFKGYYQMVDQPLPDYFNAGVFDDFRESSRNRWAKLYLTQESDFVYRKENDSLLFDISKLNSFNGFTAEAVDEYRNSLPIEICVDGINGKTGKFVELKAPDFYQWLGINNPHMPVTSQVTVHEQFDVNEAAHVPSAIEQGQVNKPKKRGFWARLFG